MKKIISLLLLSLIATSCGNSAGGKKSNSQITETQDALENADGTYLAVFEPVNKNKIGTVVGSLTILKEADSLIADIRLNNGNVNVVHRQNIHIGSKCPTLDMDVNHDGYIDIIEARPAIDSVLIPLDGDLNSQLGNSDYWPISDQYGSYMWGKTASYASLVEDLISPDANADDNIVKLDKSQALSLIGKVIIIQGVAEIQPLPPTVATMGRFSKYQTLPVACGVITKVTTFPGIVDNSDEVPGAQVPEGETVGGSGGAEDGSIFRNGETSGGRSF